MKKLDLTLLDLATVAVAVALLAMAAWTWVYGPVEPVPMQFGLDGDVSRWSDRREAAGLMVLLALVAAAVGGGNSLYARRTDDPARARTLRNGQLVALLATGGIGAFMGFTVLTAGGEPPSMTLVMGAVSLLFAMIGAFLGRVGPNVGVGVRTPWTYKSRLAWDRSNRLAGRLFFLFGLLGLAAAPFAPQPLGMRLLIGAVLLSALASIVESWRVWRADPDRQPF